MVNLSQRLPRRLEAKIREALNDTRVVLISGPRQSGKSTLAGVIGGADRRYVDLDDALTLAEVEANPSNFIAGIDGPVTIDEVQRVPELFLAIKQKVDRDPRPGRFLLTGSANYLVLPRVADSLAGRIEILTLWPFAQTELERSTGNLVDSWFADGPLPKTPPNDRNDVLLRLLRGGFPEAVARGTDRRAAWFASYVTTVVEREVRNVADISGVGALATSLRLLGARTSSVLNVAELSRATGTPHTTLQRYLGILEATYLMRRIPAWSGGLGNRALRHPKVVLCDTGLAAHLQAVDAERLRRDPSLVGPLLETFVAMELFKHIGWSKARASLFHYRTRGGGNEVDLVLERADGALVGIEVKATDRPGERDLKALREFSELTRRKFKRGIFLCMARTPQSITPYFHVLPLSALWS